MIGKLFLICAPSGAGKTTLVNYVLKDLGDTYNIRRAITYTSRLPRVGEIHGEHYFFIDELEFEKKIQENYFIEWSKSYGTYYGSSKTIIEELKFGRSFILIVDINGVREIYKQHNASIVIRILPPSLDILIDRLNRRSTENSQEIQKRLDLARSELENVYISEICKHTVVNDSLEYATKELRELIIDEIKALDFVRKTRVK